MSIINLRGCGWTQRTGRKRRERTRTKWDVQEFCVECCEADHFDGKGTVASISKQKHVFWLITHKRGKTWNRWDARENQFAYRWKVRENQFVYWWKGRENRAAIGFDFASDWLWRQHRYSDWSKWTNRSTKQLTSLRNVFQLLLGDFSSMKMIL